MPLELNELPPIKLTTKKSGGRATPPHHERFTTQCLSWLPALIEYRCTRLPQKEWPRSSEHTTLCRGDKRRLLPTLEARAKHGECPVFCPNPMLSCPGYHVPSRPRCQQNGFIMDVINPSFAAQFLGFWAKNLVC